MNIEIDDEMMAAVETFEKELSTPVLDDECVERFNNARTLVLSKLLSKITVGRALEGMGL